MNPRVTISLSLLSFALIGACAPRSVIRRSAFIPAAAMPARTGAELYEGQVRLSGHVNAINGGGALQLEELFPDVGDPGVYIPDFELGASVYGGVAEGLELGAQLHYASLDWAHANAVGVLPIPRGEDLVVAGVGARYNFLVDHEQLRVSALGELNYATIPQAVYLLDERYEVPTYRFERVDRESFTLMSLGLQVGWDFLPDPNYQVFGYLIAGAQQSVTNIGFDDDPSSVGDSTLESFWVGYLGLGLDARIDRFTLGASLYFPFESVDRIDFGPSAALTMGVVID